MARRSSDVVVVGGGFAGFWAAVAARRVGGPGLSIALVNDGPDLVLRPGLYEANPAALSVPLDEPLNLVGVDLVVDRVTSIDPHPHEVHLASGDSYGFRAAVVATGSRMQRPPIEGAGETFSIDTQPEAVELDRHLARLAMQERVRIVVVGAGFTGIELALELPARLAAHGRDAGMGPAEIVLVDRADAVGPELGAGPRPVIESALDAAGITCRLGASIQGLGAGSVRFADGTELAADAVVLCTGQRAADLDRPLGGVVDELGRYRVGPTLQHPDHPSIFVTGDVASVDTGTGHLALQSCQHALQLGRVAGENVALHLRGAPLVEYFHPTYVTCLDLGAAGAVFTEGWDRTVVHTGATANARKRRINEEFIVPDLSSGSEGLLAQSETTARRVPTEDT